MEQLRPCALCRHKKCYEATFWLGCYYYCEGESERAAALFEETLKRDVTMTMAKFLLDKIRNGDCGFPGKSSGQAQEPGQKQGLVARLFGRKKGPAN